MTNTNLDGAKRAFETFCSMMDKREWNYEKDAENLRIETGARGDDLPISLKVAFDPDCALVLLYSPFAFNIPQEQMEQAALAICIINDNLIDGNFDLDVTNGRLCYRMSMSFRESLISEEAFDFFLGFAIHVTDEYNDKLLMLAKGMLTPGQLLEQIKND